MREQINKIAKTVIKQINYLGENTLIGAFNEKVSSIIIPDDTIFDKKEIKNIVPIIVKITGSGNPMKLFIYTGYLIRRCEGEFLTKMPKATSNNIYNNLKIASHLSSEEIIKKIAYWLDESATLGFGNNIKPFLYQPEKNVYLIINEIIKNTRILKRLNNKFLGDENYEEIMSRNLTFGYCLRVAYEIFNNKN